VGGVRYRIFPNKRPGALIFRLTFLKKLLIKNAINSHFSFFWPYKDSEGALIGKGRLLGKIRYIVGGTFSDKLTIPFGIDLK
jgi:hypothetical protein